MNNIAAGQKIAISVDGAYNKPYRIETVKKVTATQIALENGDRYMIDSRRKVGEGNSWYSERLAYDDDTRELMSVDKAKRLNAEWLAENELRLARRKLNDTRWQSVDDETIRQIVKLLDQIKQGAER